MQNTSSGLLRLIAIATAAIFTWNQIALADGVIPYETCPDPSAQATVDPAAVPPDALAPQLPSNTTIDFLLGAPSPLSAVENVPLSADPNTTYDDSGRLRTELTQTGSAIRHVYENETIQTAIDSAAGGDIIYVHAGTYHQRLVLKAGVSLKGEAPETTIIDGGLLPGSSVIRALGDNLIEGVTITGARDGEGETAAAIKVEGDHVNIQGNKILFNLSAGVYVGEVAEHVSITGNLFNANVIAIREPRTGNTIRYNTITGYENEELIKIKGFRYISNQGFQLEIQDPQGAHAYYVEYSDDKGVSWKRARVQASPGIFKDQLILANPAGNTLWLDDGSTTTPNPLSIPSRLYRVRLAESFMSQTGIEMLGSGAPKVQNNIIAHQKKQSVWEESPGNAEFSGNVFFHNQEKGDATGAHLPPAIDSKTGEGWTGNNVLSDPQFTAPAAGDYSVPETSAAFGRGAFLPEALMAAVDRAGQFDVAFGIETIRTEGQPVGYRVRYSEGSVEEFYNDGRQVLDTTPPVILFSSATLTNDPDYTLCYMQDGVQQCRAESLDEGENVFTVTVEDIFGNRGSASFHATLDQTPPSGTLRVNDWDEETDSREVVLSVEGSDSSPLQDLRFSLDGGNSWTDWAEYSGMNVVMLPEGEGAKEILCQLRDAAGNSGLFSGTIRFTTAPARPVIEFLSAASTSESLYVLRYTVNGAERQETWRLQPGENHLMVCVSLGAEPVYAEHAVTLNQSEGMLPAISAMPPAVPAGLVSLTTQDGFVLGYQDGNLFSIEKPGEYGLFYLDFSAEKALTGGVLFFENGDRLYYLHGKPFYRVTPLGEKTVYNEDGTVARVITLDNKKIRFAYRYDGSGKVISILGFEEGVTSFYDDKGRPVWIKKADGTTIQYEDGFLTTYTDAVGNEFRYEVSALHEGLTLTGYLSELMFVKLAGTGTELPVAAILADPQAYPSLEATLADQISKTLEYDAGGTLTSAVSFQNEVLELKEGLPVSFTSDAEEIFTIGNPTTGGQQFFSVLQGGEALEQIFGADGALCELRMSDGVVLKITGSRLESLELEDGSLLTQLVWDGHDLTGFVRVYPDGAKDTYQNSRLVRRQDPQGTISNFYQTTATGYPRSVTMEGGITYSVSEVKKSMDVIERSLQLTSIQLPGGGVVQFSDGKPMRYSESKAAFLDPADIPTLLEGRFFVPLIQLTNAQLRSLTVDQHGTIFSGQILFSDGTQYLIEDQKISQQITAFGQLIELGAEALAPVQSLPEVPVAPLIPEETDFRNELIEMQMDYFMEGKGIHAGTGLPVDNYLSGSGKQSTYSQTTLVGFWAEILSSIATGDYVTPKMLPETAFDRLEQLLTTYRQVQQEAGWNGMVAFFSIEEEQEPVLDEQGDPTGETKRVYHYGNCFNQVGFGDVLNLSVSLASVIGALGEIELAPSVAGQRDRILESANAILADQEAGYAAFYDPAAKRFHGAYGLNGATRQWEFINNYYLDRTFNEFRTGLVWLASKYPQYADALKNLDVAIRPFETQQGKVIDLAAPYDGGAFQMFWPLIHVDETQYPEFRTALRNFLYAQAAFVGDEGIPGLLSAGDEPLRGYQGKIGLPDAAETDDRLKADIGSLYGTAAAFPLAPHYTLQFFKNLLAQFPEMSTPAGFVDAIQLRSVTREDPQTGQQITVQEPVYADQYYGVDQASFILSLLRTSQTYFSNYLQNSGGRQAFDELYRSMKFNLAPVTEPNPPPPDFGQDGALLYDGGQTFPDGLSGGLVKQPGFIAMLQDPELGQGHVFNYVTSDGSFHHMEIEFGEGQAARRMNLQEYFLSPKHTGAATALLGGIELDLFNRSTSQGVFFTPGHGYAMNALSMDPILGAVRRVDFDFQDPWHPVGIWANYSNKDLSGYDFLSVPVKLASGTPENIRLKFELKGMGEIFVTGPLTQEWNYLSIPIPKPSRGLSQLAVSIQPCDGQKVAGGVYLGPLSAMKIRTSNDIHWETLLGRSESEIRALVVQGIAAEGNQGGWFWTSETLENFTIDAAGKLVSGVLKRADGGIQYFQNGKLVKWIFKNGRTVLFEKGLASFVIDLARGKLETGRFYYDQDLRGTLHSFVLRDNESERVFNAEGELESYISGGRRILYENGRIKSVSVPEGVLLDPEFSFTGELLRAHVLLLDGTEFDIDQTQRQTTDVGEGVRITYQGSLIHAIETPQNGRTDLAYSMNAMGKVMGVTVSFREAVMDPQTGEWQDLTREMSLFEYLNRPERAVEKAYLLEGDPVSVLEGASVTGFSTGTLAPGEKTQGVKGDYGYGSQAAYFFGYNDASFPTLGVSIKHPSTPVHISSCSFLTVTLRQDPAMNWAQDFTLTLKSPSEAILSSFYVSNVSSDYQSLGFPVSDKTGIEGEIDLEVVRESGGANKTGAVFLKDISYMTLRTLGTDLWEDRIGISAAELQSLRTDAEQLTSIGAEIASGEPLVYSNMASKFDVPTKLVYLGDAAQAGQLIRFKRFDGSQVELNGNNDVTRVILPNGIVNEYETSGNVSEGTVLGLGEDASNMSTVSYNYGALRRIVQPGGQEYLLSYESDTEGGEVTVFKDTRSGTERRFKDGKLISSEEDALRTRYLYAEGELIGAELIYHDRVLNSTRYVFDENGTQVTDERGTVWFYDANGVLIRHMTRDGYLYEYSEYTQEAVSDSVNDPLDYKQALFQDTGLQAVSLRGYQTDEGNWIRWEGVHGSEIHLASGAQGLNLEFDENQKISSGQIQFPDGMILEIEHYVPVRGRFPSGQIFEYELPEDGAYELLQEETGAYQGFRFQKGTTVFTYDALGVLIKTESESGETNSFSYQLDAEGIPVSYTKQERRQIAFSGVPFPKEAALIAGPDQKLLDSGKETAAHQGAGFLAAVYKEATNQWDAYSGTFSLGSDRVGLQHFLSQIKPGESVAVVVSDPAFSLAGDEVLTLLEGLGAGQVRAAATAGAAWCFFGNESLSPGQGRERVGGGSFSTVSETILTQEIADGQSPEFQNEKMFLGISGDVAGAFSDFLTGAACLKAAADLHVLTVYNGRGEIVFSRRIDGVNSFYEHGKVRETFEKDGALLSVQEYDCPPEGCVEGDAMNLRKITLVKARQDFEEESARLCEKIEQAKFDALYQLAWQDEVARLQIRENVDLGVAQINSQIASLTAQRFQTVKQCQRFIFWKSCKEYTYEVPGVQTAINELIVQRAELLITGETQLAGIPGAVAARKSEIEQATAERMAALIQQEEEFLLDILHQEMEPVLTDLYRRVLGRDASKQEFDAWVGRFKQAGVLDIACVRSELENSQEKVAREDQKRVIIQGVRDFLGSYLDADGETRAGLLQSLRVNVPEAVALSAQDVEAVLEWLETRDLHFGQSAFLSLQEMLAAEGAEASLETLGKETILIDILTGTLTRFTEGDLLISMFALDRAAKIHARDFSTVQYSYQDLRDLYQNVCPDLEVACSLRVIAHVGEDHFVVVKRVTDTEVVYEETGKGAAGEDVTVKKEDFLRIWEAKDRKGYLLVSDERVIASKKLSDREAMRVRGAFFFIFFVAAVLSIASMIVSTFSPTFGKILGYAALVAGIIGIVGSLGQFIVQGVKMVFSSIGGQGIFTMIKQGVVQLGKVLFESVKSVGRFVQKAFIFIKDGFSGGLGSLGSGLMRVKDFLLEPAVNVIKDGVVVGQKFSLAQATARSLVAAGLNWGVAQGLEGLGLDPRLTQLAAAFVGGAFLGIGQASTSFLRSGLSHLMLQGVSQMALHLGLAPPFASVLSIAGDMALSSLFDANFNLKSTLTSIAPTVASKLTLGGLELLGRSMGMSPVLTNLLGLPISSVVGNVMARLSGTGTGYRDDGTPIYVTNPYDTGSLWDSIKNSMINGIQQVGLAFAGATSNPIFGSLLSGDILSSLAGTLNADSLFSGILHVLRTAILAPFNTVSNIVQGALQGLRDFSDLIREKGLVSVLESWASAIFSRNTLEKILGFGGISHVLDSSGKTSTTLANGQQGFEQKLDGSTSLFFDLLGNFVGKKENGVTQLGAFGVNSSGKWALLAGTFIADIVSGYVFAGEVSNGQLKSGKLYAQGTVVGEFLPTESDGSIMIDGSSPDAEQYGSQAGFWGMVFKFLPYAMNFVFSNGLLQRVDLQASPGSGQAGEVDQDLYVLANGINNVSGSIPLYIRNLEYDLFQQSLQEVIPGQDTLPISLYHPTTGDDQTDGGIDVLKWVLESQSSTFHWALVMDVIKQLAGNAAAKARPIVAMGYSGGLLPLVEGIAAGVYNVKSIVGIGAATLSLASSDMIDTVLKLVDFAQNSIGKVLGWFTSALDASLRFLLGALHLEVLNVGHLADELIDLISRGSSLAIDKLREIVAFLPKVPAWNFPMLAERGAEAFVNIYGTKDILYEIGISGYRESLLGFSVQDEDHPLFNVEIKGAEHLYYMKRDDLADPAWNLTVSDFVTQLMLHSGSSQETYDFLKTPPSQYSGCIQQEGDKWVVRLPGWQTRESV